MQGLIEILKSNGKKGAVGLMLLGLFMLGMSYFKGTGQYQEGAAVFFMGMTAFGIRSKQDTLKQSPAADAADKKAAK